MEPPPIADAAAPRSRAASLASLAGAAALFVLVAAALQWNTGSPLDGDTAYHVAVGRLIARHGILHAFPWTPFSWLAEHYADKELAFHLALAAVAGLPWATAARAVGTIWCAGLLLALHLILRAEKVRLAWLWALLPLVASSLFLFRVTVVRPHVASVALAAAILWAAVRGRPLVVAALSALYPWFYVAWPLAIAMPVVAGAARALRRERPDWKPVAAAAVGLAIGVALHPNAANLFGFTRIQLVDVLVRGAWGREAVRELGDEFRAATAREWATLLAGAVGALGAAAVLAWRAADDMARAFAIAAACFLAATVRTIRFGEYFVPFSVLALAFASRAIRWRWFAPVTAACLGLYSAPAALTLLSDVREARPLMAPEVEAQLAAAIPPGAQVFTCEWEHTGTLMLALPERRFMVALDPTFFYALSPGLYEKWFALPRQPPEHPAGVIRETFGARYVVCRWQDRSRKFFNRLALDGDVRSLLMSADWEAYDLGP